jgi:hypothetical protein
MIAGGTVLVLLAALVLGDLIAVGKNVRIDDEWDFMLSSRRGR